MGCKECKELNKENMEILIEKRQDSNDKHTLDLNKEVRTEEELRNIYYSDLNNEQALFQYLNALKNNKNMKEFESELLLYFDVLSARNRSVFTGIKDFVPSIDIFRNIIKFLSDYDFDEVMKMEYYRESYDICGRKKYII